MITILKASAGSGKTYNLAREYIRLLLTKKDPQAYRHILAVTFTNKATDEMKRRILDELFVLSTKPDESPYFKDFVPAAFPTAETLQKRASGQLGGILHDYSSFAVSTIDKFFQQTLRAFSREIGQFASYQVELDKAALVEESVDRILDGLTEDDRGLLGWLTENVKAGLESGNRFNLEPPLKEMAVNLKSTDHAEAVHRYGIDEDTAYAKDHLKEIQKGCAALADAFVKDVCAAAKAVLDVVAAHGVDPADSNRGFLKALYGFRDLGMHDAVVAPTDSFLDKPCGAGRQPGRAAGCVLRPVRRPLPPVPDSLPHRRPGLYAGHRRRTAESLRRGAEGEERPLHRRLQHHLERHHRRVRRALRV